MPNFDELKEHVNKLNNLLDEPQPGLFTWCEVVFKHWRTISNMFSNIENQPAKEKCESLRDTFLEPIDNYTFGRGVQKGSHGKYRWWICRAENTICPDFELAKMGIVDELPPDEAMQMLHDQGDEKWKKVLCEYPMVAPEMIEWENLHMNYSATTPLEYR